MLRFFLGVWAGWFAATLYIENDRDVAASVQALRRRADRWLSLDLPTASAANGHRRGVSHRRRVQS